MEKKWRRKERRGSRRLGWDLMGSPGGEGREEGVMMLRGINWLRMF
jgi:hypothetical protein